MCRWASSANWVRCARRRRGGLLGDLLLEQVVFEIVEERGLDVEQSGSM